MKAELEIVSLEDCQLENIAGGEGVVSVKGTDIGEGDSIELYSVCGSGCSVRGGDGDDSNVISPQVPGTSFTAER